MHPHRQIIRKLGLLNPTLRPMVEAHIRRESRVTEEPLRARYENLGAFGGTDPIEEHWVLEVKGPTYQYKRELTRFGLQWYPRTQSWQLDAVRYRTPDEYRSIAWEQDRRLQMRAWPFIQRLVKDHNDRIEAQKPQRDPDAWIAFFRQQEKMRQRLSQAGIEVSAPKVSNTPLEELRVFVSGNTYPIRELLRKHKFHWDGTKKVWWMFAADFEVVGEDWMSEVIRGLPRETSAVTTTPFSDMSPGDLEDFLLPFVDAEMERNDWYDGEVQYQEILEWMMHRLRDLSPADQTETYEAMKKKGPENWFWR